MKYYIGIDIGTTNTKVLLLSGSGSIERVIKRETPVFRKSNELFFDIETIEEFLFSHLAALQRENSIGGISFTSVAESVVPVARGRALMPPLMWNSRCTEKTEQQLREKAAPYIGYEEVGVTGNYTFTLYKMCWMLEQYDLSSAEYWLPLSSYFIYRLCGTPVWSESQACRTLMYNVHTREWCRPLIDLLALPGKLGPIQYTGTVAGETKEGIPLILSGHDHITGLYGISLLSQEKSFIYQSMGSSSLSATVLNEKAGELHLARSFSDNGNGTIGAAFGERRYFLQNSFRYFGLLLKNVMQTVGYSGDLSTIKELNSRIAKRALPEQPALFMVEKDPIFRNIRAGFYSILNIPTGNAQVDLIQSCYIYLAVASQFIANELSRFIGLDYLFFAGGGFVENSLYMSYKASLLKREVYHCKTTEITALGAALSALSGADAAALADCLKGIELCTTEPNRLWTDRLESYYHQYSEWKERDF